MLLALRSVLAGGEFQVVGETHQATQVLQLVAETQPDLVLLDIRMPQLDGLVCLERIRKRFPQVKVVMVSAVDDQTTVAEVFKRGAAGFISKRVSPDEFPQALLAIAEASEPITVGIEPADLSGRLAVLTEKEQEVLRAASRGFSNREIGRRLWITEQTVKFHLTNIYRKIGVANRTEAVSWALHHGLIERAPYVPLER